jgi:cytochrome P450
VVPKIISTLPDLSQTVSAMTSFFYLMEMNPEVQKRAQADIDKVTGGSRLPIPDDEEKLPYIVALIKEVIRWNPVAPLGITSVVHHNQHR